jgi:hypothetical protein
MKRLNSFSINQIIEANMSLPSIKKDLETKYKFYSSSFLKNPKYIQYYLSWNEEKKDSFIKLIGGKANFKKTKKFLEETYIGEFNECK